MPLCLPASPTCASASAFAWQRLNEDICTLSTLCSSYKKLSPTTEFPPMQLLSPMQQPEQGDVMGILNLLKMWHTGGQLQDARVSQYLRNVCGAQLTVSPTRIQLKSFLTNLFLPLPGPYAIAAGQQQRGTTAHLCQSIGARVPCAGRLQDWSYAPAAAASRHGSGASQCQLDAAAGAQRGARSQCKLSWCATNLRSSMNGVKLLLIN